MGNVEVLPLRSRVRASALRLWGAAVCASAAALLASGASAEDAQPREAQPQPRDAAEKVQEGNVPQWLEYYRREREQGRAPSDPAASTPTGSGEPADPGARPSDR